MIQRNELAIYLDNYLACEQYNDYAPNGLQIEGKGQIRRIATAVTASLDVIRAAINWQTDALLVHHGFFWRGEASTLIGIKRQRIASILEHDINLYAYHLPLDCHLELGNNACIAKLLQVDSIRMHKAGNVNNLLWSGHLPKAIEASELSHLLHKTFHRLPEHIKGHDRLIQHIAWCSGGGQDFIVDASQLGADVFISGEMSLQTYYLAKELGIHYYCCGHHATERYGIQALGSYLSHCFELEHSFFDSNNPN